LHTLPY